MSTNFLADLGYEVMKLAGEQINRLKKDMKQLKPFLSPAIMRRAS